MDDHQLECEMPGNSAGKNSQPSLTIFIGLIFLAAAPVFLLKFGINYYVLTQDLKSSECRTDYWKGVALGQPKTYCPPGCRCISGIHLSTQE